MSDRIIDPHFSAIDENGDPLVGAKLYFYDSGSTTLKDTYSDSAFTTPNTNPVLSDEAGRFGNIFAKKGEKYNVILTDKNDNQLTQNDPVWSEDLLTAADVGALSISSNLSDLSDKNVAKTNLNLPITSSDYATASDAVTAALSSSRPLVLLAGDNVELSIPSQAAGLENAAEKIRDWVIPDNASVTIKIPSGVTTETTPVTMNMLHGKNVIIRGESVSSTTISSINHVGGVVGAWLVELNVADTSGAAQGGAVIIRNSAGSNYPEIMNGIWRIYSVGTGKITITHSDQNSSFTNPTITGGDITIVPSVIDFNSLTDGIRCQSSIGFIKDLVLAGGTGAGSVGLLVGRQALGFRDQSVVTCNENFGIIGFEVGAMAHYGGAIDWYKLVVSGSTIYGALAQHAGAIFANEGYANGCLQYGIAASNSGDVSFHSGQAFGNGYSGIYAFSGGSILAQSGKFGKNVGNGLLCNYNGAIRAGGSIFDGNGIHGVSVTSGNVYAFNSVARNNVTNGMTCTDGGSIYAFGSDAESNGAHSFSAAHRGFIRAQDCKSDSIYAGNGGWVSAKNPIGTSPTYSPAANTYGNEEGYIDT